ncbi:MAG: tetratricopeptide repeat protein [Thermodesulfobacteriota bacterium]
MPVIVALALSLPGVVPAAEPPGTPASQEALALCHRAQSAPPDERDELLRESLERADAAVAADDGDALAHFARFCALGEQARRSGASLSSLVKLWSIRDAVDRTLELAPDFPDALLGKGALLSSVPRLLGGDPKEGERLVRRALDMEPDYVGARLFLAEALLEDGRDAEAKKEAERALASAERKNDPQGVADARRLLASIADDD